jgi:hypothetical protein
LAFDLIALVLQKLDNLFLKWRLAIDYI